MTNHNCVRNPETGACYVCRVPMRLNYIPESKLDAIIDATQHPQKAPMAPPHTCACGTIIKQSETECIDCWIAGQTKQPPPKPVKQTKRAPLAVNLDSILDAMLEKDQNKWN